MSESQTVEIEFTGEFFVPGQSAARIERDHFERYRFAAQRAAGKAVLDIACGVGYSAPMLLEGGAKSYLGVDLSNKQVAYATSTYGSPKSEFFVGNICTFAPGKVFDLICCFETIEHVPEYQGALQNLRKLLAPGGELLISSPNRPVTSPNAALLTDKPSNEFHTQEFTPDELLTALRTANFQADSKDVYGQRLRRVFSSWTLNRWMERLFGDPNEKTSATVTPLNGKTPRYFVIRATGT